MSVLIAEVVVAFVSAAAAAAVALRYGIVYNIISERQIRGHGGGAHLRRPATNINLTGGPRSATSALCARPCVRVCVWARV